MKKVFMRFGQIVFLLIALFVQDVTAQVSQDSQLFKTLKVQDSLLFQVGFNNCDLQVIENILPEQLEFFHDRDGIITSRHEFMATLRENLCASGRNVTERILVAGSLEVFPLFADGQLYGAIQVGLHQFDNTSARFTHLWLKDGDRWFPAKMLSYDHQTIGDKEISNVTFIELSLEEMSLYQGAYEFSADFTLSIIQEDGKLFGDAQGQKVAINPYDRHKFLDESQTMNLKFLVNKSGSVTGLEMEGPEGKMLAKKIN